jgi:hypothetical protein
MRVLSFLAQTAGMYIKLYINFRATCATWTRHEKKTSLSAHTV